MNVLFLTMNPNLASTTRALQNWLRLGEEANLVGCVAVRQTGELSGWLAEQHIEHVINPMPWPDRKWPVPGMWQAYRLARWARAHHVDVIHCNEHDVYPFGLMLRKVLDRPLTCHVRFRISGEFCQWAFGKPERTPDALLWTSAQQQSDCREAVGDMVPDTRQHIVFPGIDTDSYGQFFHSRESMRTTWNVNDDHIVLGTATAFRPHKRVEDFIELVAQLHDDDPRVRGVVAGDSVPGQEAYRDSLVTLMKSPRYRSCVQWLGHVEPIEPLMQGIDLFVSTSQYETFGNSVCEAMACRRPVTAYEGGSVKEVIGDAGFVVPTDDCAALLDVTRRLVNDAALRAQYGQLARQRVEQQWSARASLSRLKNVCERIAA